VEWCISTLWTIYSSFNLNGSFDLLSEVLPFLIANMCRIPLLFLPLLLRLMTSRVLLKANFLFVVIKVGKLEDCAKLTMNFLANFCRWLFAFVSKVYFGQYISREGNLRQRI